MAELSPCHIFSLHVHICEDLRFTPVVFDNFAGGGERGRGDSARTLVTWISQRFSCTSHRTSGDINLDLAQPSCDSSAQGARHFARLVASLGRP